MRTRVLAFLGGVFVLYWLLASDPPVKEPLAFDPVKPSLIQVLNPPYAVEPPSPVLREPATPAKELDLEEWLHQEAAKIGQIDKKGAATEHRLVQKVAKFKLSDLRQLKTIALDTQKMGDERFLAVYLLGLSDSPSATPLLKDISLAEIREGLGDREKTDEVLIRTQALEGLVHRLGPAGSENVLLQILERTNDPVVARHIQFLLKKRT